MAIRTACESDLEAILDIYNHAVLNATATSDLVPRSMEAHVAWFAGHVPAYPMVVWDEDGSVLGWASLSPYHARPAYRFTAEASAYES